MLCALAARDILWLRGTLVLAQGVLATYAWSIGIPSVAAPENLRALYERHFFRSRR